MTSTKAIPDDRLVAKEGVLDGALTMVPRPLLPLSPTEFLNPPNRSIPSLCPLPSIRYKSRPRGWNDQPRPTLECGVVDRTRVVGGITRDAREPAVNLLDVIETCAGIVHVAVRQNPSNDPTRPIDTQRQLLPATFALLPMLDGRPLALTHDRESRAIAR